jgi:hypothetical protein
LNFVGLQVSPDLFAMKFLTLGLVLLSVISAVLCVSKKEIVQLTDSNFDAFVGDSDEWLVEL